MVWVYDRTRSLVVAMIMHASQTATTLIFAIPATDMQAVGTNLASTASLWLIVTVAALANHGTLGARTNDRHVDSLSAELRQGERVPGASPRAGAASR